MPGIKEVKHFTETASSDSKSQDLHDDPIQNGNPSTKSSNLNYLDTTFNALESNIPYDSKEVSSGLYETFNSYIRTVLKIKHPPKPLSKYTFPK